MATTRASNGANGEAGERREGDEHDVAAEGRTTPRAPRTGGEFLGRHRLSAAIARLNQEIQNLQDELEELETMELSSAVCKEVFSSPEGKPDALLPITVGPQNAAWDRWFQRVRSSHSNKWWMHKSSSDASW